MSAQIQAGVGSGTPSEARAKRTHARRSCDVCKVRKTRCELPDLEVPSGPTPLPSDKACHRCRVLALPCIVDDSGKKQRKRAREDQATSSDAPVAGPAQAQTLASIDASLQDGQSASVASGNENKSFSGPAPKRRSNKAAAGKRASTISDFSGPSTRPSLIFNHSLDLMHGISPLASQPASLHEAARIELELRGKDPKIESSAADAMKLHGRPAELTCAMLKVAYGKVEVKRRGPVDEEDLDLNVLVDEQMRAKLDPGFLQLKTYHPHLDPIATMFESYNDTPNQSIALLLSTVLYLSSLAFQADAAIQKLRTTLTPYINHLRDRLLLQLPRAFQALQALDLLATHAPLGILPFQHTNLRTLSVARGQMITATHLMDSLQFNGLVDQVLNGPGLVFAFECSDIWLWLGLVANQASIALEDLVPVRPNELYKASRMTDEFLNYSERSGLWQDAIRRGDLAGLVGKLIICDKLARLEEVLTTSQRLRSALESSVDNLQVDPVREIVGEFERYDKRLEEVDRRYDVIMHHLAEYSQGIETGAVSYRAIRRQYETSKIYVTGLRMLMATHYLPGCVYAYPGLPPGLPLDKAVSYAVSRAFNPTDIVRFITDTSVSKAAVEAVWDWGRRRGINTEACLVSCAELGQHVLADLHSHVYAGIVPFHEVICIANESAKVLIEMEAGTIQILRSTHQLHKAFRVRSWLVVMQQVSETMRSIGMLSPNDDLGGDSLANGCGNLIGSMVRTAEEWTKSLERESALESNAEGSGPRENEIAPQVQTQPPAPPFPNGNGNGLPPPLPPPPHTYEPVRQPPVTSHQQYMDTSDRWMASSESHPAPHTLSQAQQQQQQQQPVHTNDSSPSSQNQAHGLPHLQSQIQGSNQALTTSGIPPFAQPQSYQAFPGHTAQQPYYNSALDHLLSQMFGYAVPPDGQQPQSGQGQAQGQSQMQHAQLAEHHDQQLHHHQQQQHQHHQQQHQHHQQQQQLPQQQQQPMQPQINPNLHSHVHGHPSQQQQQQHVHDYPQEQVYAQSHGHV